MYEYNFKNSIRPLSRYTYFGTRANWCWTCDESHPKIKSKVNIIIIIIIIILSPIFSHSSSLHKVYHLSGIKYIIYKLQIHRILRRYTVPIEYVFSTRFSNVDCAQAVRGKRETFCGQDMTLARNFFFHLFFITYAYNPHLKDRSKEHTLLSQNAIEMLYNLTFTDFVQPSFYFSAIIIHLYTYSILSYTFVPYKIWLDNFSSFFCLFYFIIII